MNIFRFIAEETNSEQKTTPELTSAPTWIIDPIDGTTNFVHGFNLTCISVALSIEKEVVIGIVYNPILDQMFTAIKGHGAYLNNKRINTSKTEGKKQSYPLSDHSPLLKTVHTNAHACVHTL
jgi:fructose-1,6-bisphosphatase/inositol monophosphatase family enzyme